MYISELGRLVREFGPLKTAFWPAGRPTTKRGSSPGLRTPVYPYVALRCPIYRENSHANHTWHQHWHEPACFLVPAAPSPWVRFPSPAPLQAIAGQAIPAGGRSSSAQNISKTRPSYGAAREADAPVIAKLARGVSHDICGRRRQCP